MDINVEHGFDDADKHSKNTYELTSFSGLPMSFTIRSNGEVRINSKELHFRGQFDELVIHGSFDELGDVAAIYLGCNFVSISTDSFHSLCGHSELARFLNKNISDSRLSGHGNPAD